MIIKRLYCPTTETCPFYRAYTSFSLKEGSNIPDNELNIIEFNHRDSQPYFCRALNAISDLHKGGKVTMPKDIRKALESDPELDCANIELLNHSADN